MTLSIGDQRRNQPDVGSEKNVKAIAKGLQHRQQQDN
jgi:hypothetical protein